jgi:hypothetical protein
MTNTFSLLFFIRTTKTKSNGTAPIYVRNWVQQDSSRLIIQSVIKSTTKRIKRIGYADPEKPFLIQKRNPNNDPAHFDAEGQRELGVRYFLEYLRIFLQ